MAFLRSLASGYLGFIKISFSKINPIFPPFAIMLIPFITQL